MAYRQNNSAPNTSTDPRYKLVRGSPQKIAAVLSMALRKHGLDKAIRKYEFVLHWPEIVGASIAERTRPEGIERETLTVRCVNSEWAQELVFQKDIIIKRLNKFLEAHKVPDRISDVRFFVGPITK